MVRWFAKRRASLNKNPHYYRANGPTNTVFYFIYDRVSTILQYSTVNKMIKYYNNNIVLLVSRLGS